MSTRDEYLAILLGKEKVNLVKSINCERPGCESDDVKTWEWATRAADEGVTIFHRCRKCQYVWMDS
jgi:DNA-directed RNA polymerase subunit M/transcription elongation factor TFIIS